MKAKKIWKIVFYTFDGERKGMEQACIFYTDGTVKNVSKEAGDEACEELEKELNIKSTNKEHQELKNRNIVYKVTGEEYSRNFRNYLYNINENQNNSPKNLMPTISDSTIPSEDSKAVDVSNGTTKKTAAKEFTPNNSSRSDEFDTSALAPELDKQTGQSESSSKTSATSNIPVDDSDSTKKATESKGEKSDTQANTSESSSKTGATSSMPVDDSDSTKKATESKEQKSDAQTDKKTPDSKKEEGKSKTTKGSNGSNGKKNNKGKPSSKKKKKKSPNNDLDETIRIPRPGNSTGSEGKKDGDTKKTSMEDRKVNTKKEGKIKKFFKNKWQKLKNSKLARKIAAITLAVVMIGATFVGCNSKNAKKTTPTNTSISGEVDPTYNPSELNNSILNNNEMYDEYSFPDLLGVTKNDFQRKTMQSLGLLIQDYNGDFADVYEKTGTNRFGMTFEELVALQQGYNNYSQEEIKAYFNGKSIKASDLKDAYKSASKQLMEAYTIEKRDMPVDIASLISSPEGKDFYENYHEMFWKIKEAENDNEKESLLKTLVQTAKQDFPKDDSYSIPSYKLSVTPILAATENMYKDQYSDILGEDFLNDIGLLEQTNNHFTEIENITASAQEDEQNPTYDQYRNAIIDMMVSRYQYPTNDEEKNLNSSETVQESQTSDKTSYDNNTSDNSSKTVSDENKSVAFPEAIAYTEHAKHAEFPETMTYKENQDVDPILPVTDDASSSSDSNYDIDDSEENDTSYSGVADETTYSDEDDDEYIEDDDEYIEEENDTSYSVMSDETTYNNPYSDDQDIEEENITTEDTESGSYNYDDEYTEDGALSDSVENVTTDSTGYQATSELPNEEEAGAIFENQNNTSNESTSESDSNEEDNSISESDSNEEDNSISESDYNDEDNNSLEYNISEYEEAVDQYVEEIAATAEYDEEPVQYTYNN